MDSYTIESFIQWCNNITIAQEGVFNKKKVKSASLADDTEIKIKTRFFGKPCQASISNLGYDPLTQDNISTMKTLMKISTTDKRLYDAIYSNNKKFFDYTEEYDYANGRKIRSGADLIDAIYEGMQERNKGLDFIYDEVGDKYYMCGEIWIDEEHGFSIHFPKLNGNKIDYSECKFGQYGDAL